jgi:hypothetical protein
MSAAVLLMNCTCGVTQASVVLCRHHGAGSSSLNRQRRQPACHACSLERARHVSENASARPTNVQSEPSADRKIGAGSSSRGFDRLDMFPAEPLVRAQPIWQMCEMAQGSPHPHTALLQVLDS